LFKQHDDRRQVVWLDGKKLDEAPSSVLQKLSDHCAGNLHFDAFLCQARPPGMPPKNAVALASTEP